jgi:hypothetical protein
LRDGLGVLRAQHAGLVGEACGARRYFPRGRWPVIGRGPAPCRIGEVAAELEYRDSQQYLPQIAAWQPLTAGTG